MKKLKPKDKHGKTNKSTGNIIIRVLSQERAKCYGMADKLESGCLCVIEIKPRVKVSSVWSLDSIWFL